MKLKNNSARGHWLGNVLIAPMEIKEVGDEWRNAYNKADLEEVKEAEEVIKKPSRKSKEAETEERRSKTAEIYVNMGALDDSEVRKNLEDQYHIDNVELMPEAPEDEMAASGEMVE